MSVKKISEAILGVGVDDTTIDLFEIIWSSPTWSRITAPISQSWRRSTRKCRWLATPRLFCIWISSSARMPLQKNAALL